MSIYRFMYAGNQPDDLTGVKFESIESYDFREAVRIFRMFYKRDRYSILEVARVIDRDMREL